MTGPLGPGATVGVLGGGQLGRMLALAARRMGYATHVFTPETGSPTAQVADAATVAAYEDLDAVHAFARQVQVVTYEFENVPAATVDAALAHAPVRPGPHALHVAQHRLREKTFLEAAGLPVPRFAPVAEAAALPAALARVGVPAIVKTAAWGYDGKGQVRVGSAEEAAAAWHCLGGQPVVVEAFVSFALELSVVGARGADGTFVHWGAIENAHRDHILDLSVAPGRVSPQVARAAAEIARTVAERLELVGLLCVELFLTGDDRLLVNEIAPRPHNSGHLTIEAARTSQFEQQLRAVCGLPLGATDLLQPAAMANLLGDVWAGGEPDWPAALARPGVSLHLYGKADPRPGRKMGHLTALAPDREDALAAVQAARRALARTP